jgi:hypothetical protein
MGASPQPLHQNDAHSCILLTKFEVSKYQSFTSHLSTKVAAKISHLKRLHGALFLLNITKSLSVQPATLAEDSPNDRHQTIASNIYSSPLLRWE